MKKFSKVIYIATVIAAAGLICLTAFLILRRKMEKTIIDKAMSLVEGARGYFSQHRKDDEVKSETTPINEEREIKNFNHMVLLEVNSHINSQSITLAELLLLIGFPSLLDELDYSKEQVVAGKRTIEEHDEFFKERAITQLNKLSLKYHPDKQKDQSDEMQKLMNNAKAALKGIHEETKKNLGARYQLFRMITIHTIVNAAKDDSSKTDTRTNRKMKILLNSRVVKSLESLIKYRQGFLMSDRNNFLIRAIGCIETFNNYINCFYPSIKEDEIEEFRKVFLDGCLNSYVQCYKDRWVTILKQIKETCKKVDEMKCIEPEIDELLKAAKKEYKMLKKCLVSFKEKDKIKLVQDADACFVQPVIYYTNLVKIYSTFLCRLSNKQKDGLGGVGKLVTSAAPILGLPDQIESGIEAIDFEQDCREIHELSDTCYKLINNFCKAFDGSSKEDIKEELLNCANKYSDTLKEKFKHIETYLEREQRINQEKNRIIQETVQKEIEMEEKIAKIRAERREIEKRAENARQETAKEIKMRMEAEEQTKQAEEQIKQAEEQIKQAEARLKQAEEQIKQAQQEFIQSSTEINVDSIELVKGRGQEP